MDADAAEATEDGYLLSEETLARSYCIGWIISGGTGFYALAGLILAGWDIWNVWDVGGVGVVWTNVSRRRNGSATISAGMGAPPLAIEGRWAVGSGGWHQFFRCCKGVEYFCRSRKIIQIDCTQIVTNT